VSERPNVLLITTDHWPGHLLGCAGHEVIQTPTLDQLAANGVRFSRAYSECPVCVPARRTLMTGTTSRTHGDRVYNETLPMPDVPTLAQTFRDHGYQAFAVGKLHVYPQRSRIGFDDVVLNEEGRLQYNVTDDYETFLGERGHAGRMFMGGMCNNEYLMRPWHLPEECHPTAWATREMCRTIKRRDPGRPSFWYLSYMHPHPPLWPLREYLDIYRRHKPNMPYVGDWAHGASPHVLRSRAMKHGEPNEAFIEDARAAFYAQCTYIDHQLRAVLGTLREERLQDNTMILFSSDHGDLLGDHGMWGKALYYEQAACVPMLLCGTAQDGRVGHHRVDDRLVGWQDVMPTLLDLAGLPLPKSVEGCSMVGEKRREHLFGEIGDTPISATRMMHDGRHKLIYYPAGNVVQLFDLLEDPDEMLDHVDNAKYAEARAKLERLLIRELYGGDELWVKDGKLVGLPPISPELKPNRTFSGQRGSHWPPPVHE